MSKYTCVGCGYTNDDRSQFSDDMEIYCWECWAIQFPEQANIGLIPKMRKQKDMREKVEFS